jgi:hypothetical protein
VREHPAKEDASLAELVRKLRCRQQHDFTAYRRVKPCRFLIRTSFRRNAATPEYITGVNALIDRLRERRVPSLYVAGPLRTANLVRSYIQAHIRRCIELMLGLHAVSTAGRGYLVELTCGGAFPAALSSVMICCRHLMPYSVKAVTPSSPTLKTRRQLSSGRLRGRAASLGPRRGFWRHRRW